MDKSSSNPVLSRAFDEAAHGDHSNSLTMTYNGVIEKTSILLSIVLLVAGLAWYLALSGLIEGSHLIMGSIGGFVLQLILTVLIIRNPVKSKVYSLLFSLAEGFSIGLISFIYNQRFPGIIFNALVLTTGSVLAMLFLYRTQIIKATENFKLMVGAATVAVGFTYLVSFILQAFHIPIPLIHESSPMGIAFSVFVLGVAVFNLVLDFDQIEKGVDQKAPLYMEWYCSFGLMVTIVWVYLEILKLLGKLNRR